jgi:predicted alpha/beta-fold hydrolase
MHASRHGARLLALGVVLALLAAAPPAWTGGLPEEVPANWARLQTAPRGEILPFLEQLPHDPSFLGVRAAHLRPKAYPYGFEATTFPSADGTPLGGRLWVYGDVPRPGVVLVPGLTQTKDQKFMVELAALFRANGWHVLAMDLRGHGTAAASRLPSSPAAGRKPATSWAGSGT